MIFLPVPMGDPITKIRASMAETPDCINVFFFFFVRDLGHQKVCKREIREAWDLK